MSVYIAGPMTGLPEFNFPAFAAVARELRAQGCDVVSPHEISIQADPSLAHGADAKLPYEFYLRNSPGCDEVVLLPGWERSKGACLEREIAQALKMTVTEWNG
jgi:Domain of unknown function (DUF4406)